MGLARVGVCESAAKSELRWRKWYIWGPTRAWVMCGMRSELNGVGTRGTSGMRREGRE